MYINISIYHTRMSRRIKKNTFGVGHFFFQLTNFCTWMMAKYLFVCHLIFHITIFTYTCALHYAICRSNFDENRFLLIPVKCAHSISSREILSLEYEDPCVLSVSISRMSFSWTRLYFFTIVNLTPLPFQVERRTLWKYVCLIGLMKKWFNKFNYDNFVFVLYDDIL